MIVRRSVVTLTVLSALAAGCSEGGRNVPTAMVPEAASSPPAQVAVKPNCFAPLPGHPTAAEKRAFVDSVAPLAKQAEQRYGVPAAAITAMAIQESGYGWTQLAQHSNNILAWKYTTRTAAGGRAAWELQCPEQGTSDRYIVFRDRAEAVDYVARQLATSDNYRADTAQYRRARGSGTDVAQAVDAWVDGIADPYSSKPDDYRQDLRRIMNDPYAPSNSRSPNDNLYRLSESVSPPPAQSAEATGSR